MSVCADGADGLSRSAPAASDGPALYYVARDAPGLTLATAQRWIVASLRLSGLSDRPRTSSGPIELAQRDRGAPQSRADGAVCRIARRHGKGAGDDIRLPAHPQAIRKADRQLPGAPAPGSQHLHPCRGDAVAGLSGGGQQRCLIASIRPWPLPSKRRLGGRTGRHQNLHPASRRDRFTDEHDIGLYLKRAMLLSSLFGNAAAQRRRYIALAGLSA